MEKDPMIGRSVVFRPLENYDSTELGIIIDSIYSTHTRMYHNIPEISVASREYLIKGTGQENRNKAYVIQWHQLREILD